MIDPDAFERRVLAALQVDARLVCSMGRPPTDADVEVQRDAPPRAVRPRSSSGRPRLLMLASAPDEARTTALLAAGAGGVIEATSSGPAVASAAVAVARGYVVLPSASARLSITGGLVPGLSAHDARLLRRILSGASIRQVADLEGVSLRTVHRRLDAVYRRLGGARWDAMLASITHDRSAHAGEEVTVDLSTLRVRR